jgi:DNA polymerase
MPHRIRNGLIDYLEIMQMTGITELGQPVNVPSPIEAVPGEKENERNNEENKEEILPAKPQPIKTSAEPKPDRLRLLAQKVAQCSLCNELALTRTQTVFGIGNPDAELVFLGEAPGADEDKQGEPFVGRAGQLLNDIITKGMKIRREDVYICNILRCRPPGNRNPLPDEAARCRPFLDGTLEIIKPKFICCLGAVAAQNLLQTDRTIGSMRGKVLDYNGIKVICTYHPAYLLRNPPAKKQTWDDIKILMGEMGLPIQ